MIKLLAATCLAFLPLPAAWAQCASWTPGFHSGGADRYTYAFATHDDGSGLALYAGGDFTHIDGVDAPYVARWNGQAWQSVGASLGGYVLAFAEYQGDLIAGGAFPGGIARWDGSSWNALGSGFQSPVQALAVFGGELYAGGGFITAGGVPAAKVARWNGTNWSAVGAGLPGGGAVHTLLAADIGFGLELFAGGQFPDRVARWNGSAWTAMSTTPQPRVLALAAYDSGSGPQLYAGTEYGGVRRWTGAGWTTLPTLLGASVLRMLVHDDGSGPQLYASGEFSIGTATDLARWNGSVWSSVSGGTGADTGVAGLGSFDDGSGHGTELWIGGSLTKIDGILVSHLAAWDGTSWRVPAPGNGIDSIYPGVVALGAWDDDAHGRPVLAAGGTFARAGATAASNVAIWDGLNWSALGSGTDGLVEALAAWDDPASGGEALYVGGSFLSAGGVSSRGIARWDGSAWSGLDTGVGGVVVAMTATNVPQLGGPALFVGGSFATAGSINANSIARWDGTSWSPLGGGITISGMPGGVHSLLVWDDPNLPGGAQLYVGGGFAQAGSVATWWAARWDGATWWAMDAGLNQPGAVRALTLFDAGAGEELYALGSHGEFLHWSGASWSLVPGAPALQLDPWSMVVHDDGSGPALYVSTSRWDGSTWSLLGTLVGGGGVRTHLSLPSGAGGPSTLWIGGVFTGIDNLQTTNIARWSDPCAELTSYCTAKVNSQGCLPGVQWSGEPSVTLSATTPFVVGAHDVINQKTGTFFYGTSGRRSTPFQGGTMCVAPPTRRTPYETSGGNIGPNDCSGVFALDFTPWIQGNVDLSLSIGVMVEGQWWYRDPPSPSTTGLSDAIELEIRP